MTQVGIISRFDTRAWMLL